MRLRLRPHTSIAVALILLPVIAYARVLFAGFLNWDDWDMVASNLDLRPDHWPAILDYWQHSHLRLFVPLTYSAYALLEWLSVFLVGSVQPWWFHAANLVLHVSSGLLLWKLLTRISGDFRAAAIGAGLFLLHPMQVEAVAWISSLNTVLSAFLAILTLWLYVQSLDRLRSLRSLVFFIAACMTAALAMLAKPSVCGLPIMAWAIHRTFPDKFEIRAAARLMALAAIEMPMAWIAHRVQSHAPILTSVSWSRRPLVAADTLGFYVTKLLVPIHLGIDYGRTPQHLAPGALMAVGFAFLFLLLLLLFLRPAGQPRALIAGGVIFFAGLLPVLGFVPFDFQFYSTVADRYVYLAMLGPALVVTDLVHRAVTRSPGLAAGLYGVAGAVLLVLLALSVVQAGTWTSDDCLFAQALRVNPNSVAANQTLGYLAAQDADRASGDPHRAIALLASAYNYNCRALAVNPDNPRVRFNRANLLLRTGHPDRAIPDYAAAAGRFEDEARLQNNWGVACLQLQQVEQAIEHFHLAAEAAPASADAYVNAGTAYLRIGQTELARAQFLRALALDPNQAQAKRGLMRVSSTLP